MKSDRQDSVQALLPQGSQISSHPGRQRRVHDHALNAKRLVALNQNLIGAQPLNPIDPAAPLFQNVRRVAVHPQLIDDVALEGTANPPELTQILRANPPKRHLRQRGRHLVETIEESRCFPREFITTPTSPHAVAKVPYFNGTGPFHTKIKI